MSTTKQFEANRRNAAKSTGPRTESGKANSRFNALKTGLDAATQVLPGESPEAFASLAAEYYDQHRPTTAGERVQIDILISSEWLLRRLRRIEHQIWEVEFEQIAKNQHNDKKRTYGEAYKRRDETFARLQHRINATHRQLQAAQRTLLRLQALAPSDSQPLPIDPLDPQIGFVPPIQEPLPVSPSAPPQFRAQEPPATPFNQPAG